MNLSAECCRICLSSDCNLVSIFTIKDRRYLPNVIYNISGVKLLQNRDANAKICKHCSNAVVAAESIIMECQKSEEYFSQLRKQNSESNTTLIRGKDNTSMSMENLMLCFENSEVSSGVGYEDPISQEDVYKNITSSQQLHKCQHCPYQTKSRLCLVDHYQKEHNLDESSMYKCSICAETFSWRRTLFMHMEKEHRVLPREKKFLCDECGKAYFKKRFLDDHIKQRHMTKLFKCPHPECKKSFNRKFTLRRHFESMHTELKRYHCEKCNMNFSCLDKCRYHIQSVHQRKHCPNCGIWFRKKHVLDAHIESQKCAKCIYTCSFCPRRFTTERGVKVHIENSCKYKSDVENVGSNDVIKRHG